MLHNYTIFSIPGKGAIKSTNTII